MSKMTTLEYQQARDEEIKRLLSLGIALTPLHGIKVDGLCTCGKVDCASGGKHPIRKWSERQNQAYTSEEADRLFSQVPCANIGILIPPNLLRDIQRHERTPAPSIETPYGIAVKEQELDVLRRAPEGERNNTLNRCAFNLARLYSQGHLIRDNTMRELYSVAIEVGLPHAEVVSTIESGTNAGQILDTPEMV